MGAAAADDVTTRLHSVRSLQLIERAQLYRVLQEQKFNLSDLVDPSYAVKVGKLLGAEQMVVGAYAVFGGSVRFNARFVDVTTGTILSTSQVSGVVDPRNPDALWKVFEQLAQATIDSLNQRVAIVQGVPTPTSAPRPERIEPTPEERGRLAKASAGSLEAQEAYGRGLVAYRAHRWAEAARHLERATALDAGYAAAWLHLGAVRNNLGQWPAALRAWEQARQLFSDSGDEPGQAMTLNNIGEVYRRQGRYAEALGYYERSLRLEEKLGNALGQAMTLNNIGIVHDSQGRHAEALGYYERSLHLKQKVGDELGQAATLNNIADVHLRQGRHAEALAYFERSLRLSEKLGDEPGQAGTLGNIAVVNGSQGRYTEALAYFNWSLRLSEKLGNEPGQALTLNNIGEVYRRQGRYAEALEYYKRALAIADRLGMAEREGFRHNRDRAQARIR